MKDIFNKAAANAVSNFLNSDKVNDEKYKRLKMFLVDGKTLEEIAAIENVKPQAIKEFIHRRLEGDFHNTTHLGHTVCFSFGNIIKAKSTQPDLMIKINNEVLKERQRQNEKWGIQRHDYGTWLKILIEEVGEVAQAMQTQNGWGKETDAQDLYEECIHVAAVASAIAEQVREYEDKGL